MSGRSALRLYDCLMPKVKELSLNCENCRKKRDAAGIKDVPVTRQRQEDMFAYWNKLELETRNADLEA